MQTTARQLFKLAHRAARLDFYAVADFPGFGRAAQYAVGALQDPLPIVNLAGKAKMLRDLRAQPFGSLFA